MGVYEKDTGTNQRNFQWPKLEQFKEQQQQQQIVLEYKPKYKKSIGEFIIIKKKD